MVVTFAHKFDKDLKHLGEVDRKHVRKALAEMEKDPHYPGLRTKHVHAELGLYESSANMDVRILWCYRDDETIETLEVGHHDVLHTYMHGTHHER
jgi:mRNA-degrading endonuclease RelE of RelBE toxin-antitoxin system